MNKNLVVGAAIAGLAAGCGEQQHADKLESLPLTVRLETYPSDPDTTGGKGSGDLGQASRPLKTGKHVTAACVQRTESVATGQADVIKPESGEYKDQLVPLQVFTPTESDEISKEPRPVFNLTPDQIRDRLDFC